MNNNKYTDQLIQAMSIVAQRAVNTAGYDKTIQATVISCIDQTIGKYKVRYQDSFFYAYSNSVDVRYIYGTSVYILVPKGDMNADKTIIGSTQKLGINYIENNNKANSYSNIGNNIFLNVQNEFSLCSYDSPQSIILYDPDENISIIEVDENSLQTYLQEASHIKISALIQTNLPIQQRYNGDYGLKFYFDFRDNTTGAIVTRFYDFNIDVMEGNPYLFNQKTLQQFIYEIDKDNFVRIKRIELFCKDFPNVEENHEDDIFISNINLIAVRELTSEEKNGVCLELIAPKGYIFTEEDGDDDQRRIQAQVKVKTKLVDLESQPLSFYWFVENANITSNSDEYSQYGGQGWKCLNSYKVIREATSRRSRVVEFNPGSNIFTISKKDILAQEIKYKCVLVYEGTVFSKDFTIINDDFNYSISIESDRGTEFNYDNGKPNLTCNISNKITVLDPDDFIFHWSEINNFNIFNSLSETTELNTAFKNAVNNYNSFKTQIDNETIKKQDTYNGNITNIQHLNDLKEIIQTLEENQRVEKNHIYNVSINEIINLSTFKCSVYNKTTSGLIGTASIVLTNKLSSTGEYTLVINNGTQNFNYNEYGVSPTSESLENPFKIPALSFSIYDEKGILLQNIDCTSEWIVPVNNSMLSIPSEYEGELNEDGTSMVYRNYKTLNYNILEKYFNDKVENTIQLRVYYKSMILIAETNLSFSKQGDPGTNGTEYQVKIVPYVSAGAAPAYPTVTVYENNIITNWQHRDGTGNGKWFNIQLWHNGIQIFNGYQSGTTEEDKQINIQWGVLRNSYTSLISDNSCIAIDESNGSITFDASGENTNQPVNIVKATVQYDGLTYYATIPIITVIQTDISSLLYTAELKENTGFRYAIYKSDGTEASYNNRFPFEIIVKKKLSNNNYEDISINQSVDAPIYSWNYIGSYYDTVTKKQKRVLYLTDDTKYKEQINKNQHWVKPVDGYDGQVVNNAITVSISIQGEEKLSMHIPVHLLLNRYGNAALNGWDGNNIDLGGSNNGMILAPQVGAGQKENDNSFTGIVIGKVKGDNANASKDIQIGLFGYEHGERSIFLDAETGQAVLGKAGAGQIIMDPSTDTATISSGNYDTVAGTGMEIDLTDPHIKFGSGNFIVDSNGHVTLKGATIDSHSTIEGLDSTLQNLQNQIDKQIETYTGENEPTLNNYPASSWTTTEEKDRHIGDLYYISSGDKAGYSYRFQKTGDNTYAWRLIKDTQITKALGDAALALEQIEDTNNLLVSDYYTKTDTDHKFEVSDQKLTNYMSQTDSAIADLQSADETLSGSIATERQRITNLSQDVDGFKTTVSNTYSTKVQAQGYADTAQANAKQDTATKLLNYSTTTQMNSAITQKANEISQSVSQTYITKTDSASAISTAKDEAISAAADDATSKATAATNAANAATDQKLTSYSTTTEMNSAITQKANEILSTVSETYQTVDDMASYSTTTEMNSAITQKANEITQTVSQNYATKTTVQTVEGKTITGVTIHYLATDQNSGVTRSTSGWTTEIQTITSSKPYLWTYNTYTYGNNTTKDSDPIITGTYGEKGDKGDTGIGISNITEYYALNNSTTAPADSNFSTGVKTPTAQNRYLWNYELITYTNNNTKKLDKHIVLMYSQDGDAGRGVSNITEYYALSTNTTAPGDSSFNTSVKTPTNTNKYLWNYEVITYTDTTTTKTDKHIIGVYGDKGQTGTSISILSTSVKYQKGDSGTTKPTGTWQTGVPQVEEGKYLWSQTIVNYSDNTSTESYSVSRMGTNGSNGTSPTVTETVIEYQQSTSGTTVPTGTWETAPPTATAGRFMWTRTTIIYSDNVTSVSYSVSKNGTNGNPGNNTAIVYLYKRSASTVTIDWTSTLTYTFSTHKLSSVPSGWYQSIPSGTDPLYVTAATAYGTGTTDTIPYTEWSTPVILSQNGENGDDGLNSATVFLYQRATSAPAKPSTALTYTFATGKLSGTLGNWVQAIPAGTDPCYVIQATAISKNTTDSISASEWSTVTKLVENGADGNPGNNTATVYLYKRSATTATVDWTSALTYTFSTHKLSTIPSGWYQNIPAGTDSLYVTAATAYGTGTTDSIAYTEWSEPVILSQNGTDGLNSATVFLYQRAASTPSKPSGSLTYTFATGKLSGTLGNWTQTIPTGTNPCYVIQATAISTSATDTIAASEWSDVTKLVENGAKGTSITISSTSVKYQKGDSGTVKPTGTWGTDIPVLNAGDYLWTQTIVNYNDGTSTESYSVSRIGTNGNSPTVSGTVTKYQQSTNGTTVPTGTWETAPPTATAGQYMWTQTTVTYSDGATAVSYNVSKNGTNGNPGNNTATVYLYKRSSTAATVNWTNALTYTFSTHKLSSVPSGWYQSIPSGTDPLYVTAATAYGSGTTDSIAYTEWSAPVILSQDGKDGDPGSKGLNSATVFLYQRATSTPLKPTAALTYTFSTGKLSGTLGNWVQEIPTGTNPCYVIQATAISTETTDSIAASEWSDVTKLVEDGAKGDTGIGISSITPLYFSKADTTAPLKPTTTVTTNNPATQNEWNKAMPDYSGSYPYVFTCSETKYTNNTYAWSNVTRITLQDYEIGGRNLLLNTGGSSASAVHTVDMNNAVLSNLNHTMNKGEIILTPSTATSSEKYFRFLSPAPGNLHNLQAGESYTLSFYYKGVLGTDASVCARSQWQTTGGWTGGQAVSFTPTEEYKKFFVTDVIPTDATAYYTSIQLYTKEVDSTIYIKNLKLEKGNKATDWTPAPEDIVSSIIEVSNRSSIYVRGTQAASTSAWLGNASELTELVVGTQISYYLPYASTSTAVTLNLTLADGSTTGAKNCFYNNTTRLSTQYGAGAMIAMMYDGTTWRVVNPYTNSNTYDRTLFNNNIKAAAAISASRIIVGTASGYKMAAADIQFDTSYPILWAAGAINANEVGSNNYLTIPSATLRNNKSGITLTQHSTAFLVGTLQGSTFTIDSAVFSNAPTTKDGKYYIPVGMLYSTYQVYFEGGVPDIYEYGDNGFQRLYGAQGVSITKVVPLYYASNSTTKPAKPTTEITSTSTAVGDWRTQIPTLTSTYKYLHTCNQVYYSDGSLSWSDVTYDPISTTAIDTEQRMTTAESQISQNSRNIELKVSESDLTGNYIIGKINLESTTATIEAANINLNGAVTANNYFKINLDGSIEAKAGKIGGFDITSTAIQKIDETTTGDDSQDIIIASTSFSHEIYWGSETRATAIETRNDLKFCLGKNFAISATGGLYSSFIQTGSISVYSLWCKNGRVGGWTVRNDSTTKSFSAVSANQRVEVSLSCPEQYGSYVLLVKGTPDGSNIERKLSIDSMGYLVAQQISCDYIFGSTISLSSSTLGSNIIQIMGQTGEIKARSFNGTATRASQADALLTNAGNSSTPVYFASGIPKAVTQININDDIYCGSVSSTSTLYCGVLNKHNNCYIAINGSSGQAGMFHTKTTGSSSSFWITYINAAGTITRNTTSDRRIKDEIGKLSDKEATAILSGVEPINFVYKEDDKRNVNTGIYAQDLRDILINEGIGYRSYLTIMDDKTTGNETDPEVYYELDVDENYVQYGIDYSKLVSVLIKGWQMHEQKIKELEQELKGVKNGI